jgi:hypothetical protein
VQEGQFLARSAGVDWSSGDRLHSEPTDTSATEYLERFGCGFCTGEHASYKPGTTAFDDHLQTHGINTKVRISYSAILLNA